MKSLVIGLIFLSFASAHADDTMKPSHPEETPTISVQQNGSETTIKDQKAVEEEKATQETSEDEDGSN